MGGMLSGTYNLRHVRCSCSFYVLLKPVGNSRETLMSEGEARGDGVRKTARKKKKKKQVQTCVICI